MVRTGIMNTGPQEPHEEVFFKNYKPSAQDTIHLPKYVVYLILASMVVLTALFAIIRHLIKDLIHDLADWLFGEQEAEVPVDLWDNRDKFIPDWCPEMTPELEEMAREEQIKVVMEGNEDTPAIWVTSDVQEPLPARSGPRVSFGDIDCVSHSTD